jgi:hypothetical protein
MPGLSYLFAAPPLIRLATKYAREVYTTNKTKIPPAVGHVPIQGLLSARWKKLRSGAGTIKAITAGYNR